MYWAESTINDDNKALEMKILTLAGRTLKSDIIKRVTCTGEIEISPHTPQYRNSIHTYTEINVQVKT